MKKTKQLFLSTLIIVSTVVLASCAVTTPLAEQPTETTAATTVSSIESSTEASSEPYEPYYIENLELTSLDGSKVNYTIIKDSASF